MADRAGFFRHVFFIGGFHGFTACFLIAALQGRNHALERRGIRSLAAGRVIGHGQLLAARAVEQGMDARFGNLLNRRIHREAVLPPTICSGEI